MSEPVDMHALHDRIYAGEVIVQAPNEATRAIVAAVRERAEAEVGSLLDAHTRMSEAALFAALARIRAAVRPWTERVFAVIAAAGLHPDDYVVDAPRVRAIAPHAHRNPAAAAVYAAHRDTWYANPRAQLNLWVPLHDVAPGEGFAIFPRCFARPVRNSSAEFDYTRWRAEVGFGRDRAPAGAIYPQALEAFDEADAIDVNGPAASATWFAGAHLHRTHPLVGSRMRWSIDFRAVHLADHRGGRGAPSVDDRSRGSALVDYVRAR